jgi:hypothetical protein
MPGLYSCFPFFLVRRLVPPPFVDWERTIRASAVERGRPASSISEGKDETPPSSAFVALQLSVSVLDLSSHIEKELWAHDRYQTWPRRMIHTHRSSIFVRRPFQKKNTNGAEERRQLSKSLKVKKRRIQLCVCAARAFVLHTRPKNNSWKRSSSQRQKAQSLFDGPATALFFPRTRVLLLLLLLLLLLFSP